VDALPETERRLVALAAVEVLELDDLLVVVVRLQLFAEVVDVPLVLLQLFAEVFGLQFEAFVLADEASVL
jgi:hypothetical protein